MIFEPFPPFLPSRISRQVRDRQLGVSRSARALRRQVFCDEQRYVRRRRPRRASTTSDHDRRHLMFARRRAGSRRHRPHPRGGARRLVGLAARRRARIAAEFRRVGTSLDPPCRLFGACARLPTASTRMCKRRMRRCSGGCTGDTIEEIDAARPSASLHAGRSRRLSAVARRRNRVSVATEEAA